MKLKSWLKYFIYIVVIFFLITLREYVEQLASAAYYRMQYPAINYYTVISFLLGVSIGLLLGLDHLLRELAKNGKWQINLPKLILLGIPSLYFSLTNIFLLSTIHFLQVIFAYPLFHVIKYGSDFVPLFQLILGYVIITSFDKNK